MAARPWRIQLLGEFRIESPDGGAIQLASRKARGLLGLLALADGLGLAREELADSLWPAGEPEDRRTSLRQALAQIRRAFGNVEAVEAGRDFCRLALAPVEVDAAAVLRGEATPSEPLLPEMTEPVFDRWRTELDSIAAGGPLAAAARAAAEMLDWLADHAPERALDVLYGIRELVPYLPIETLERIVPAALADSPADHPVRAWAQSQLAMALMWNLHTPEGMAVARETLAIADPDSHGAEWTEAAFSAGVLLIYQGRFAKAQALLESALRIARERSLAASADRLRHGLAHCHAYQGDLETAVRILRQLPYTGTAEVDALRCAHLSMYLVFLEQFEEAEAKAREAARLSGSDPNPRLQSQILGAEALTRMAHGRFEEAQQSLHRLLELAEHHGMTSIEMHALEMLAALEPTQASRLRERAKRIRSRLGLAALPLDRIRYRLLERIERQNEAKSAQ